MHFILKLQKSLYPAFKGRCHGNQFLKGKIAKSAYSRLYLSPWHSETDSFLDQQFGYAAPLLDLATVGSVMSFFCGDYYSVSFTYTLT